MIDPFDGRNDHLPRLDPAYYRGNAYVHWTMTIQDRRVGWLTPQFYSEFREMLTHTAFRYSFVCPIFCLMPEHIHQLWMGVHDKTDQLNAMKHFRRNLSTLLNSRGFELQSQPFDHVLREHERQDEALFETVDYIARNPERRGLVAPDGYSTYPFTQCLLPGYPSVSLWQSDYWDRFWRIKSFACRHGLFRAYDEDCYQQS